MFRSSWCSFGLVGGTISTLLLCCLAASLMMKVMKLHWSGTRPSVPGGGDGGAAWV